MSYLETVFPPVSYNLETEVPLILSQIKRSLELILLGKLLPLLPVSQMAVVPPLRKTASYLPLTPMLLQLMQALHKQCVHQLHWRPIHLLLEPVFGPA